MILEWFARDNLSSTLFALVPYRHVKNRFIYLSDIMLTQQTDFDIYETKFSIYDIYALAQRSEERSCGGDIGSVPYVRTYVHLLSSLLLSNFNITSHQYWI